MMVNKIKVISMFFCLPLLFFCNISSLWSRNKTLKASQTTKPLINGINGHPLNQPSYLKIPLKAQLAELKRLKIGYYRFDVPIDTLGNVWNKNGLNQLTVLAKQSSIGLLPMIYLQGLNFKDNTNISFSKGYKIGSNFAKAYGRYFSYCEIGNEEELHVVKNNVSGSDANDYDPDKVSVLASFMNGMITGIKSRYPQTKIIINTGGWFHFVFFSLLEKENVKFDIIGYHWYADMDAYSKKVNVDVIKSMFDRYKKPIWFTEINTPFGTFKASEIEQQQWLTAFILSVKKYKAVQAIFIYELIDETELPETAGGERFYGITKWKNNKFIPKKAAYTYIGQ